MSKVGVVVPTLFERPDYLMQCLESVRLAGPCHISLLGPNSREMQKTLRLDVDSCIEEPAGTLSLKIDYAIRSLPLECAFVTWLGDDDLLEPNAINETKKILEANPDVAIVFGGCNYIDAAGKLIGRNRSFAKAIDIARWGPFLAPQPGSLYRRSDYYRVGGLDHSLKLAFDMDLFISLSSVGRVKKIRRTVANFRWHGGSLTVSNRHASIAEGSLVRRKQARNPLEKKLVLALNPVVEMMTKIGALLFGNLR